MRRAGTRDGGRSRRCAQGRARVSPGRRRPQLGRRQGRRPQPARPPLPRLHKKALQVKSLPRRTRPSPDGGAPPARPGSPYPRPAGAADGSTCGPRAASGPCSTSRPWPPRPSRPPDSPAPPPPRPPPPAPTPSYVTQRRADVTGQQRPACDAGAGPGAPRERRRHRRAFPAPPRERRRPGLGNSESCLTFPPPRPAASRLRSKSLFPWQRRA